VGLNDTRTVTTRENKLTLMQELHAIMNKIIFKRIVTNMKMIMLVMFMVLCCTPKVMGEISYVVCGAAFGYRGILVRS